MQLSSREVNGIAVYTLVGRIDSGGATEMDDALQVAAGQGKHKVVLDMSGVTYMNSAGLRTLADILTRNRANGGDLRLVALNSKVERVFKIIGFDKFFDTYDTVTEATADF